MQVQQTDFDELENDIVTQSHELNNQNNKGWFNKRWTREVKNAVGTVLKKKGYKVLASNFEQADGPEWLFDLTGIKEKDGYLKNIPLVLESEWRSRGRWRETEEVYDDNILYDFRKLLVSRADHRVIVFEAESEEKEGKVVERLLHHVQNCRHSTEGDRYMFACCRQVEKKWVFDCSVYKVVNE